VRGAEWGIAQVEPASHGLTRIKLVRNEVMSVGRPQRYVR